MNSKHVLAGVMAATVLNGASASNDVVAEKQVQAVVMTELLDGMSIRPTRPECTIKSNLTNATLTKSGLND
ncbi:MAG: hypothetical protein K2X39_05040 [Silvanigrellaceae bacterium]|nr:hypothetical protein [Silvanigrellaceae bacterium]